MGLFSSIDNYLFGGPGEVGGLLGTPIGKACDYVEENPGKALRTCSQSLEQEHQKCQVHELQAGVDPTLTVFPQAPVLFQPSKAALDHPALGHDLERVQLAALGHLHHHMLAQNIAYALRKGLARVATVGQNALDLAQRALAPLERLQSTFAIGDVCRGDGNSVRQSLGVYGNVALDARDFLARVIALAACRVRVLHALRIHDQERAAGVAPQFLAGRANLIFLKPAVARSLHRSLARSTWQSTSAPCAT